MCMLFIKKCNFNKNCQCGYSFDTQGTAIQNNGKKERKKQICRQPFSPRRLMFNNDVFHILHTSQPLHVFERIHGDAFFRYLCFSFTGIRLGGHIRAIRGKVTKLAPRTIEWKVTFYFVWSWFWCRTPSTEAFLGTDSGSCPLP